MNDLQMPLIDERTLEAVEKLKKAFFEIGKSLGEILYAIAKILDEAGQELRKAVENVDKRNKERFAWRRAKVIKIRDLLLDKRSGVYRCRSTI